MDPRLNSIKDKTMRLRIRHDIKAIQLSNTQSIFEKACELFLKKWGSASLVSEAVINFLTYFKENWVEKKDSWYEGYAIGIPSQSNGIESSHKQMKAYEDIYQRTSCIRFMNGKGRRMLEWWSKKRAPIFLSELGEAENTAQIHFATKSTIETADWTSAYNWNSKRFSIKQVFYDTNLYMTCDAEFTRNQAIDHLEYIKHINDEYSFDTLIEKTSFFKIIYYNSKFSI
jgi:hypothetical protein